MNLMAVVGLINLFFAIVIGLYFWNLLKQQQSNKSAIDRESKRELEKLRKLKAISLSEPLSEKTRPRRFEDIVGQEDGLRALRAALCGPNPQHVLIYGPPGVGKTAAARVVLEEAKKNPLSPFRSDAVFVEVDATTARFDDRGIADPLMGSVHDPIYQGAGPLGMAGIPQPKPGAVTKAHGGVLFIDEIGELHPIQMNKLLKVLEDRKVFLESAYYSSEDTNIPLHIHEIFQKGLPADFRLIGATTRMPWDIPPAIRSRCMEVYFRPLLAEEVRKIAQMAAKKISFTLPDGVLDVLEKYATNGREAVNMIQLAAGIAQTEGRRSIEQEDVEWVVASGQYNPRPKATIPDAPEVGLVNGLAVYGPNMGVLLEIEATAIPASQPGRGELIITGVVEEEELGGGNHRMRRKSMAKGSVDNVITILKNALGVEPKDYDIHINFPGGTPVDGPSAGVAMVCAIYSAISNQPIDNTVAMTGEVSIHGKVKPVGGIVAKVEAARLAGVKRVIIPHENWQELFAALQDIEVVGVTEISEVLEVALYRKQKETGVDAARIPGPVSIGTGTFV
ncbi:MAG: ATP-dependent protease LonB [Limnochordia bacterium]|jgi:Lon-like ATP-dependent protease|nr:ATP-dependent protease LonB [Limnochordia bacterium]MDD2629591.1 ATP-dependent protease LonB [Limnochordia bacterium]MDD4517301.1 ATP-dependent protease LonB [Limnochordia bacterium]